MGTYAPLLAACLFPINFCFIRYLFNHENSRERCEGRSSFPLLVQRNESRETFRRYNGTTTIKSEEHHRPGLRDWSHREGVPLSILCLRFAGRREKGKVANRVLCFISQPRRSNEKKVRQLFAVFRHSNLHPPYKQEFLRNETPPSDFLVRKHRSL